MPFEADWGRRLHIILEGGTKFGLALRTLFLGLGLLIPAYSAELTDVTSSHFSGSANCAFCHDQWGRGLTDKLGNDVSIAGDWRGTMMAHSFKDPLWRAVMEAEVEAHPKLRKFIENKCQTCHAPMAKTQATQDGLGELSFAKAKQMPLAADGVSCTLCHQIQPGNLGTAASFSGHYEIHNNREIFGPYDDVFAGPMLRHVNYTPQLGQHVQDSKLCATCHTLFTPIVDAKGNITGEFPEQVPYLEWRNSDYAKSGKHCQDCHMERLNESIKISSRPPWLEGREPFWRHQFVGGNAFMLALFKDQSKALQPNADVAQLEQTITQARRQLAKAATVTLRGQREGNKLSLKVTVQNLSGHKFPTGHPYRRAWLHVRVIEASGRAVFESGAADQNGSIASLSTGYAAHQDVITQPDQVQVYEAVMGDAAGNATRSLLGATQYLKDNRLPPRGFTPGGPNNAHTAVRGEAVQDENFNTNGNGRDEVTYRIDLESAEGRILAQVQLLYQSVPPEAVARFKNSRGSPAKEFYKMYERADKTPELVNEAKLEF
ncbi:MAG: hypothetical protein JNN07_15775 [Verrucomicrobiales bacterium]|nr:hypothetical protein [Verrucomicrobiales bacterium]